MKRLVFSLAIIFALSACSSPTNTATTVPDATPADTTTTTETPTTPASTSVVHFYYSNWTEVTLSTASSSMARSIVSKSATDLASALEAQTAYNAAHTDDAILGPYIGDAVPITEAPEATAYIVNSATLAQYYKATVERSDLYDRREAWRVSVECMADPDTGINVPCTLYVDKVPTTPPVVVPATPKLWTALLDTTAKVIYYDLHFDTEADAQHQYRLDCSQADLNNAGLGDGNGSPGDVWQAYIGETESSY